MSQRRIALTAHASLVAFLLACASNIDTAQQASAVVMTSLGPSGLATLNSSRDNAAATAAYASGTLFEQLGTDDFGYTNLRDTCSLTFVSPHYAVTAAHCVTPGASGWNAHTANVCSTGSYQFQLYRPAQDFSVTVNETMENDGPGTWIGEYIYFEGNLVYGYDRREGYNADAACCTRVAQDNASLDLALLLCDDLSFQDSGGVYRQSTFAPGTVYGYLQLEHAQDQPSTPGRSVYMPWSHEVLDWFFPGGNVNSEYELTAHYTDQNVVPTANNLHYLLKTSEQPLLSPLGVEVTEDLDRSVTLGGCHGTDGSVVIAADTNEITGITLSSNNLQTTDADGGTTYLLCQDPINTNNTQSTAGASRYLATMTNGGLWQAPGHLAVQLGLDWATDGAPESPPYYMPDFNHDEDQSAWSLTGAALQVGYGFSGDGMGRNNGSLIVNAGDTAVFNPQAWSNLRTGDGYTFAFRANQNQFSGTSNSATVIIMTAAGPAGVLNVSPPSTAPVLYTAPFTGITPQNGVDWWIVVWGDTGSVSLSEFVVRDTNVPFEFLTANERAAWDLRPAGSHYNYEYFGATRSPMRFNGAFQPRASVTTTEAFVGVIRSGERMESRTLGLAPGDSWSISFNIPRMMGGPSFDQNNNPIPPGDIKNLQCGFWFANGDVIKQPCPPTDLPPPNPYELWSGQVTVQLGSTSETLPPEAFFIELPNGKDYSYVEIADLLITPEVCVGQSGACVADSDCCGFGTHFCGSLTDPNHLTCLARAIPPNPCDVQHARSCEAGSSCVLSPIDGLTTQCQFCTPTQSCP